MCAEIPYGVVGEHTRLSRGRPGFNSWWGSSFYVQCFKLLKFITLFLTTFYCIPITTNICFVFQNEVCRNIIFGKIDMKLIYFKENGCETNTFVNRDSKDDLHPLTCVGLVHSFHVGNVRESD